MNKLTQNMAKFSMFILLTISAAQSNALELINWDKTPIKLSINQDDERMIIIEKNISVGIPTSLQGKLRVQSLGGVLYLKSSEPFTETRLMLKDLETGEIILLDLTGNTRSKKVLETVQIVTKGESQSTVSNEQIEGKEPSTSNEQSLPIPVLLTRYAAQNYYAPLRAVEKVPGIKQVSLGIPKQLTRLLPRLPVKVFPQTVWRLKGYDVVAIKIINQSKNNFILDPRLLQGDFYSATFQHNTLGPNGQSSDTTMLYVVTEGKAINAFLPEPIIESKTLPKPKALNSNRR